MSESTALITAPPVALAETATSAQAAQAQAQALARYAMAERHPRNLIDVEAALLRHCERPGFAKEARYDIPFSTWNPETRQREITHVVGPSIRFAEAVVGCMGNVRVSTAVVFDDDTKRITAVEVTDLETNASYSRDVVTEKVIERKRLAKGVKPIRSRLNAYGDTIHLVPATEQEVERAAAAGVSKAIRDCSLRLLPGDIKDACMERVADTVSKTDASDPDKAIKDIARGFSALGVSAAQLEQLLGHPLTGTAPAELATLRAYYQSLKDSALTWAELTELVSSKPPPEGDDPKAAERSRLQEQIDKQLKKVQGQQQGRRAKPAGQKSPPPPPPQAAPPQQVDDSDLDPAS